MAVSLNEGSVSGMGFLLQLLSMLVLLLGGCCVTRLPHRQMGTEVVDKQTNRNLMGYFRSDNENVDERDCVALEGKAGRWESATTLQTTEDTQNGEATTMADCCRRWRCFPRRRRHWDTAAAAVAAATKKRRREGEAEEQRLRWYTCGTKERPQNCDSILVESFFYFFFFFSSWKMENVISKGSAKNKLIHCTRISICFRSIFFFVNAKQ